MTSLKKVFLFVESDTSHDVSIALGKLEQHVRVEGLEAKDEASQVEMAAWDFGYQNRPIPPWLKTLGTHFKIDVAAYHKSGSSSR